MADFRELVVLKKTGREHKNTDCRRCGPADGATRDPKRGKVTWGNFGNGVTSGILSSGDYNSSLLPAIQ